MVIEITSVLPRVLGYLSEELAWGNFLGEGTVLHLNWERITQVYTFAQNHKMILKNLCILYVNDTSKCWLLEITHIQKTSCYIWKLMFFPSYNIIISYLKMLLFVELMNILVLYFRSLKGLSIYFYTFSITSRSNFPFAIFHVIFNM